ncbi:hypothetical protein [Roseibium sediminis]|uniref:hypothetical protein n=1 Tax=Roseibium sediminis TaxID=1775174 RepID=UPI00123D6D7E|nr:hypothetical protein [Roseibium sediminis]
MKKRKRSEFGDPIESTHLVLTHVKHKRSIISSSKVLSAYWDHLTEALSESEEVILFGYSGLDAHLNDLLRRFEKCSKRVIEWCGATFPDGKESEGFWKFELGEGVSIQQMDNILEFKDWSAGEGI